MDQLSQLEPPVRAWKLGLRRALLTFQLVGPGRRSQLLPPAAALLLVQKHRVGPVQKHQVWLVQAQVRQEDRHLDVLLQNTASVVEAPGQDVRLARYVSYAGMRHCKKC